jgi:nitric oxide reductase NorQ protein
MKDYRRSTMGTNERDEYIIKDDPYYEKTGDEIDIFERAAHNKQHIAVIGPTGVGKSRFLKYMAYRLQRPSLRVSCTEDTDSVELTGLHTAQGWIDGPLLKMIKIEGKDEKDQLRKGGMIVLDEVIEARKEIAVIIHSLTDKERALYVPKLGQYFRAPDEFILCTTYNQHYITPSNDLKPSTKRRFITLSFDYPAEDLERKIIMQESGVDEPLANSLVKFGEITRNMKTSGRIIEGAGTGSLVDAAIQINAGTAPKRACEVAIINTLTYDPEVIKSLKEEHLQLVFGKK